MVGFSFGIRAFPSDQIAAPSSATSLIRNCPTAPERAGNPPRLGSHPGVENKNESAVTNISAAAALPMADAFRAHGRRAINIPMQISTTPNPAAKLTCRPLAIHPTQQWTVRDERLDALRLISRKLHHADPAKSRALMCHCFSPTLFPIFPNCCRLCKLHSRISCADQFECQAARKNVHALYRSMPSARKQRRNIA
jgi:hypothetical protein